jgi:hypothetical protein
MREMTITDTQDLAELHDFDEDLAPQSDMAATEQSDPAAKIEFHVQMKSWTLRDMEELIVQAAAMQMIKAFGDKKFSKLIEDRAIEAITEKADAKIEAVTAEIIDQPLTPKIGEKAPVTMREFIGLYAKDYLTQRVDRDGKPSSGGWGATTFSRIELMVSQALDRKFQQAIAASTNAMILELQTEIKAAHAKALTAEKARIRAALESLK